MCSTFSKLGSEREIKKKSTILERKFAKTNSFVNTRNRNVKYALASLHSGSEKRNRNKCPIYHKMKSEFIMNFPLGNDREVTQGHEINKTRRGWPR